MTVYEVEVAVGHGGCVGGGGRRVKDAFDL